MLSKPDASKTLRTFFNKNRIAKLPAISTLLSTTSRMSVHRRLRELDYLSSFSYVGCYYTLPNIANFDMQGLWFYQDIGFSRFGNLKETVVQLVNQSIAGKTHEELERQLRLRVHNTLLALIRSGKLTRETMSGVFVYFSSHADRAEQQLTHRREGAGGSAQDILPDELVIEVLVEIIRTNQVQIDHSTIIKRLTTRGIRVSALQLKQLCTRLDLKKTPDFVS